MLHYICSRQIASPVLYCMALTTIWLECKWNRVGNFSLTHDF